MSDCYYGTQICSGKTWTCKSCRQRFCQTHWHQTDKGQNVECVACEGQRKEREEQREEQRRARLEDITDLLRAGEYLRQIARMLDIPDSTVRTLIRRHHLLADPDLRELRDKHLAERKGGLYD